MAEILSLREIFRKDGLQFVKRLLNEFVVISEKLSATRFCFERTQEGLEFYKKDGKITAIDRTMSSLYEEPIKYIESLSPEIISELPIGFRYGFRYFHDKKPANIVYDEMPLNGLVLTDIRNAKGKIINDVKVLESISDKLGVEKPPIIWYGKLDDSQKTRILEYLRTPEEDLFKKFKTTSFTKYIISILNPQLKKTALKFDIEKSIDSIIFNFIDEDTKEIVHAKILDPAISNITKTTEPQREPQDLYGIILSDVVEFIKITGLKSYQISKDLFDERFLELICQIYNGYMKKNEYKYEGIEIDPLSFASTPKFNINLDFITDLKTRELLEKSSINKHIFKIMMSSFSKPKKKAKGTLTDMLISDVIEVSKKIKEKIESKPEVKESSLITFEEYMVKKIESSRVIKL
jgi:hypothetical protein